MAQTPPNRRRRIFLPALVALAFLLLLSPARVLAAPATHPAAIVPAVTWSGAHSRIVKPEFLRIALDGDWRALWCRHLTPAPDRFPPITDDRLPEAGIAVRIDSRPGVPEDLLLGNARAFRDTDNTRDITQVDFSRHMAIAIFAGELRSTEGIRFWSATETDGELVVRYSVQYYNSMSPGDVTHPYGIFILPLSSKKVVIEELGPNGADGQPTWTRKAILEPPKQ